jgi:hypothetical protein
VGVAPRCSARLLRVRAVDKAASCETYRIDYTDDGAVTTLTGDPVLVDVLETVVPDADADSEPEDVLKSAADAADSAAPAAGSAADAADPQDVELRALFAVNENAARFAFDL